MKLAAGLGSVDDYRAYVRAGADEVFIGYIPERWQKTYGLGTPLNRREVCFYHVQIGSLSELEILSAMAEEEKKPVTVCFNSLRYSSEQYPMILSIMEECRELGMDQVIIADMGLLFYLHQCGADRRFRIHLSGEFGEINHWVLRELAQLGVKRLIFHRKVSLSEMETIIKEHRKWEERIGIRKEEGMEFEAFLLNENCHFHGGYCQTLHSDDLVPMCRMPYRLGYLYREDEEKNEKAGQKLPANDERENNESAEDYLYDYGMKEMKKMKAMGITHLKIVGRGAGGEFMAECIKRAKSERDRI